MKEIIQQILDGNTNAFREIVREYGPEIRAFFAGSISDYQTVDDLAQETFIATYKSLSHLNEDSNLRAWIYGIAKNKLMMHLRQLYRKNKKFNSMSSEIIEQVIPAMEEYCDEDDNVRINNLKNCIEKLPEKNQDVIKSRYFTNETVIDIAQRLQKTETAISVLLYRLRSKLKDCIEGALSI